MARKHSEHYAASEVEHAFNSARGHAAAIQRRTSRALRGRAARLAQRDEMQQAIRSTPHDHQRTRFGQVGCV